jgi:hypothetical protein
MDDIAQAFIFVGKKIVAPATGILGIAIMLALLKSVYDHLGSDAGGFLKSKDRGKGFMKRANDLGARMDNDKKAKSLSGKRVFGGGRYRREARRDLANQSAEARAKSGAAQFGINDEKAAAHTRSIVQSNAAVSAINTANNTKFAEELANDPNLVREGMGAAADNENVQKALQAQQARAVAEAIKDVELSATAEIKPGDVDEMANRMAEAINKGDSVGAQAYQNMLMRSGGPGTEAYRNAMTNDVNEGSPEAAGALAEVKRNMLANHGNVKETAADLIKHASGDQTMGAVSGNGDTWKMSNEDLVKQKSHSIKAAVAAGGISSQQAREIQGDEQLYRKLDSKGREAIDEAAHKAQDDELRIAHEEAINEEARRSGGGGGDSGGASPYL